jgi:predicted transcriptional regulator
MLSRKHSFWPAYDLTIQLSWRCVLRRTRHEIQAGILKSCIFSGVTISQLMALQNLSYRALKRTLDRLSTGHLIEYEMDHRRKLVRTTDQGFQALRSLEAAIAMLGGRTKSHFLEWPTNQSNEKINA